MQDARPRSSTQEIGCCSCYHHGDLRRALVEAARSILEAEGVAGLSLRAIARTAGVSQAAPYHHFADRVDLLTTLSTEGFQSLIRSLRESSRRLEAAPGDRLLEDGRCYLRFAIASPDMYRLMFSSELARCATRLTSRAPLDELLDILHRDAASFCTAHGQRDHTAAHLSRAAWSLFHGLAVLIIDGFIGHLPEKPSSAADPGMERACAVADEALAVWWRSLGSTARAPAP